MGKTAKSKLIFALVIVLALTAIATSLFSFQLKKAEAKYVVDKEVVIDITIADSTEPQA